MQKTYASGLKKPSLPVLEFSMINPKDRPLISVIYKVVIFAPIKAVPRKKDENDFLIT
jgi:hypothetical protein